MNVDAGGDGLLAGHHDSARQISKPSAIEIEVDEQDGAAAGDAARRPCGREGLAKDFNRAALDRMADEEALDRGDGLAQFCTGNRALAGAEGDGGERFDDLREAKEQ